MSDSFSSGDDWNRQADFGCFAVVPRPSNGGTIVGGTKEKGDWNSNAEEHVRNKLLENAAKMYPGILNEKGGFDVIRDIVGRRPTRNGGMRLEIEVVEKGKIIHAYGAGGSGFEISWGVAEDVVALVGEALE